jgi:hypothetical protein
VVPADSEPGGRELYRQVGEYPGCGQAARRPGEGGQLKASLSERLPACRGTILLEMQDTYLFPAS